MINLTDEIIKKYPFLSLVVYGGNEYIGIIQNSDDTVLSIYNYDLIKNETDKIEFLSLGEVWWWESNQQIPINIFLKQDWKKFSTILVTLNIKDCEIKFGPAVNISDLSKNRSKRKNITLIRKIR